MWNAREHTDEENNRYCWLRAVEWDGWPLFISQPIAPILFNYFLWWEVILGFIILEILWAAFIRTNFISLWLAGKGPLFVMLKWVICPVMSYILYDKGQIGLAFLALFWPLVMMLVVKSATAYLRAIIFIPLKIETLQIGVIQKVFMEKIGYRRISETEL